MAIIAIGYAAMMINIFVSADALSAAAPEHKYLLVHAEMEREKLIGVIEWGALARIIQPRFKRAALCVFMV